MGFSKNYFVHYTDLYKRRGKVYASPYMYWLVLPLQTVPFYIPVSTDDGPNIKNGHY